MANVCFILSILILIILMSLSIYMCINFIDDNREMRRINKNLERQSELIIEYYEKKLQKK